MPANSSYSTLVSTTLQNFSNKIVNNVLTNNTLARHLLSNGNVKVVNGGRTFVHQILAGTNSSFAARGHLVTVPTPVTDNISAAEYTPKVISGSIVLPLLHVAMNAGDREKLLDFTNAKKMEAEVSLGEVLGDQVFNTAISDASTDNFDSIPYFISETPTAASDIGGISASANSFWRNYSHDTAVTAFNTSQAGLNAWDTSFNAATFGQARPRIVVCTSAIWTLYQLGLTNNVRYQTDDLGNGVQGFRYLQYADMPVYWDDNCPTGNTYFIDTENIKLQLLSQGNFKNTPFMFKIDQLAESTLLYVFGNLTMGSRRSQAVIDSTTG